VLQQTLSPAKTFREETAAPDLSRTRGKASWMKIVVIDSTLLAPIFRQPEELYHCVARAIIPRNRSTIDSFPTLARKACWMLNMVSDKSGV
jgi:hypothetical protein